MIPGASLQSKRKIIWQESIGMGPLFGVEFWVFWHIFLSALSSSILSRREEEIWAYSTDTNQAEKGLLGFARNDGLKALQIESMTTFFYLLGLLGLLAFLVFWLLRSFFVRKIVQREHWKNNVNSPKDVNK